MASTCELSKLAYSKIILHAFKYPHTAINGVLLANEGSNSQSVKYVDAIPLFHHNLGLAPMLEVALMQIDSYCRTAGLVIAGYYHASEAVAEMNPDPVSQKICEKIAEYFPNACLVLINNRQLSMQMTQTSLSVIQYSDGKWKVKDKENLKILPNNEAALNSVSTLLSKKLYKKFVDFDDHLDDIHQDWLNVSLKTQRKVIRGGPFDFIERFSLTQSVRTQKLNRYSDKTTIEAMAGVKLKFSSILSPSDPINNPIVIIGTPKNLAKISYNDMSTKFGGRVTEDVFSSALNSVQSSPDVCPLYLNSATISPLPGKCSRHNAPSRSHAITKCVRSAATSGKDNFIVIICEKQDVFPSATAVARAYPLYSRKTNLSSKLGATSAEKVPITVSVEYFLLDNAIPLTEDECFMLERAAESVRLTARIVDTPCNEMNTDHFLEEIGVVAKELGIEPFIIRDKELERQGFGGIYGVGKAAPNPPALVVLSHLPKGATKTIAWVGKGIMYDTGGLSIKGKTAMPGMKRDCGGASGILGAFRLAVLTGFKENLHAVFCLAENSVGPLSTRPDDIHTLYSGRTVEINNTDAEGRLVLADGVFYAHKDLKADVILDMATLTGGQSVATGKHHAAVLTNNEHWENALVDAGLVSGDLTFPIPFCPEFHFSEFNSAVADMKNSVADRSNALSSCAGLFILAHLGFDYPGVWMHVDMAAPVHCGERATGYGVALLVSLFGQYSNSALLQNIGPVLEESVDDGNENERKKKRLN